MVELLVLDFLLIDLVTSIVLNFYDTVNPPSIGGSASFFCGNLFMFKNVLFSVKMSVCCLLFGFNSVGGLKTFLICAWLLAGRALPYALIIRLFRFLSPSWDEALLALLNRTFALRDN